MRRHNGFIRWAWDGTILKCPKRFFIIFPFSKLWTDQKQGHPLTSSIISSGLLRDCHRIPRENGIPCVQTTPFLHLFLRVSMSYIHIYIYTYHYISRYNPVSCVPFHTFLPQTTSALKSHRISWDHPEATYLMVPSATAARAAARLLASTQQLHPYWGEEPLEKDFSCSIIFQDVCTWYIYIYIICMYIYIYIYVRETFLYYLTALLICILKKIK